MLVALSNLTTQSQITAPPHRQKKKASLLFFWSSLESSSRRRRRRCCCQSHGSLPLDTSSPHGLKVIVFLVLLVGIVLIRGRQLLAFSFSLAHLGIARLALGHVWFPRRLPHYTAVFVLDGTLATIEVVLKRRERNTLMRQQRKKLAKLPDNWGGGEERRRERKGRRRRVGGGGGAIICYSESTKDVPQSACVSCPSPAIRSGSECPPLSTVSLGSA